MNIVSLEFFGFLLFSCVLYWIVRDKYRKYVLFAFCVAFIFSFGLKQFSFVLVYILLTYFLAKLSNKKWLLALSIIISAMPLFISKYILEISFSIIGISFVSFRAISFIVESYKGNQKNTSLFEYVSYMLFFPVFLSGPIEKPTNFISQLNDKKSYLFEEMVKALFIMSYGYMMKIVVADRLVDIINTIYSSSEEYGFFVIVAMFMYPIYIYADFAGYSYIAYGIAKLFGFKVTMNFKQPYLSKSVKEFWNRWHVSLNIWLRDYIYIPLGGNRKGMLRKQLNILIVFIISGIWHGTGWGFVVWGLLNAIFQIIGDYTRKFRNRLFNKFKFRNILSIISTYLLISFTWIFFSQGFVGAIKAIKSLFKLSNISIGGFLLDIYDKTTISKEIIIIVGFAIMLVILIDVLLIKGIDVSDKIVSSNGFIRVFLLLILIIFNIYYGKYGNSADLSNFIYFNF